MSARLVQHEMSFFSGAKNFNIEHQELEINQIMTQVVNVTPAIQRDNLLINAASEPILDASHTRNRKKSPPDSCCLSGTRRTVLDKVISWASTNTVFKSCPHVLWLHGYVGCGKSAIAQKVAEELARRERLGASFFFFRNSGDRSSTRRLVATIADQMARSIPLMKGSVRAALQKHPDVYTAPLETQFQHLVYEPFKSAVNRGIGATTLVNGPYVVVIDGLDECEDRDDIADWIQHMIAFFDENPRVPLRFFISSRVEEHIRNRLLSSQVKMVDLVDHSPEDDIAFVMDTTFEDAAKDNRVLRTYEGQWPSTEDRRKLVEHIGGSFIFMVTILKFILEPGQNHRERLGLALDIDPGLDGLYAHTLARSEHLPHFLDIISTISLPASPISIKDTAELLDIPTYEVVQVLINLHSIFQVPGKDTDPVTLCHSSLLDFLTTQSRSRQFFAEPTRYHKRLFERCMQVICATEKENVNVDISKWLNHYALQSSMVHWDRYWNSVTGEIKLEDQLDVLCRPLRQGFTSRYSEAASCFFLTLEDFMAQIPTQSTTGALRDFLVDMLEPGAASIRGAPATYTGIVVTIFANMVNQYPLIPLGDFRQHLDRACPGLIQDSYHLRLALVGKDFFLQDHKSKSVLLLPRHDVASIISQYMWIFWPKHLALALHYNPNLGVGTLQIQFLEPPLRPSDSRGIRNMRVIFNSLAVEKIASSLSLARMGLSKAQPSAVELSKMTWKWVDRGVLRSAYPKRGIVILDVLDALERLVLCLNKSCSHAADTFCPSQSVEVVARDCQSYPFGDD